MNGEQQRDTAILPVDVRSIGKVSAQRSDDDLLDSLQISLDKLTSDAARLRWAAEQLKYSDYPVAFPTETVYGLGADATRSAAVNGIYKAKQRPADNPLIVHFSSLKQLRDLLHSGEHKDHAQTNGSTNNGHDEDPIPDIYKPLISNFWPGPLTIILRNPPNSPLAPEVTAGLETFGARMPRNVLALALIDQARLPIAAPSANASTKPSPTAAEHVYHDLNGRINTIIDGGPCDVGVESTVVDGLSNPPLILRPGGISIEQLRVCPGWENVQIGYKSVAETESHPKAPGMKYRHYSPKARVVLYEAGASRPQVADMMAHLGKGRKVGLISTRSWAPQSAEKSVVDGHPYSTDRKMKQSDSVDQLKGFAGMLQALQSTPSPMETMKTHTLFDAAREIYVLEISLGPDVTNIARGIFSALRDLDREDVDVILIEGIDEQEGQTAAAVMNRLRKAAEVEIAR